MAQGYYQGVRAFKFFMVVKQKEILESNRIFHNRYIGYHDKVNSYISKKKCKKFYENLFIKIIKEENVKLRKANVLELGCGTGSFLEFLLAQDISSYIGVDISEEMTKRAREKSLKFSSPISIDFYTAAAEDFIEEMKKRNKKFDIIFSCSFLHHLFDPKNFLNSIKDIISPDGAYIALHEPNISARNKPSLAQYVDSFFAYLFGYDTPDSGILLRIKKMSKILASRLMPRSGRLSSEKDFGRVDYQLNFISFNPQEIIGAVASHNVHIYAELYGYFVFNWLRKLSKFPSNYFYLVMRNKRNS